MNNPTYYLNPFLFLISISISIFIFIFIFIHSQRSTVYLNGKYVGGHDYGYTPFRIDVTDVINNSGEENVLVVKADSTTPDSWWYDGGGVYRSVHLTSKNDVHIQQYGVYAPSLVTSEIVAETKDSPATADAVFMISVDVECGQCNVNNVSINHVLYDAQKNKVAEGKGEIAIDGGAGTSDTNITFKDAKLWSINHPINYFLETTVVNSDGDVLDTDETNLGVRKLAWDNDKGFFLNDVNTKILGCANHQDFAGLGVAVPDTLQGHRIAKLQELGGNAWRTAHNAPNPSLLYEADKRGMLVWDENHRNGQFDEAKTLVKRDRNHPSIIIWSICNEVLCNSENTIDDANQIKKIFQENDPLGQRVVGANQNDWVMDDSPLDLLGYDYATNSYDEWHAAHPNYPVISSETSSAVSDRGEYENDEENGHVRGYDTEYPSWAQTAEKAWGGYDVDNTTNTQGILTRDYVSGGFTWTGWDYKGEPTPYHWPDINSHFGIYDIAGFDKDRVGWYKSWWRGYNDDTEKVDSIFVFPHWNWDDDNSYAATDRSSRPHHLNACKGHCKDNVVEVWVHSNAAEIEMFGPDGKSLGRKTMPKYGHLAWMIDYEPGEIMAWGYENVGDESPVMTAKRGTTGAGKELTVQFKDQVGADGIHSDGRDLAIVAVHVVDDKGEVVPLSNEKKVMVKMEIVSGEGEFVGGGNGDPSDLTNDKDNVRNAYHGKMMGLFKATGGNAGDEIVIRVSAEGYEDVDFSIPVISQ